MNTVPISPEQRQLSNVITRTIAAAILFSPLDLALPIKIEVFPDRSAFKLYSESAEVFCSIDPVTLQDPDKRAAVCVEALKDLVR